MQCDGCGYSLVGVPRVGGRAVCPECGVAQAPVAFTPVPLGPPWRVWVDLCGPMVLMLALCCGLGLVTAVGALLWSRVLLVAGVMLLPGVAGVGLVVAGLWPVVRGPELAALAFPPGWARVGAAWRLALGGLAANAVIAAVVITFAVRAAARLAATLAP